MTLSVLEKSNKCQILGKTYKRQTKRAAGSEHEKSKSKIITKCAETRANARNPETLSQWAIDLYVFEIILKFIETIYVISLKDIYRLCEQSYKCCHVE